MEVIGTRVPGEVKEELSFISSELAIPLADLARVALVDLVDEAREKLGTSEYDREMRRRRRHANSAA